MFTLKKMLAHCTRSRREPSCMLFQTYRKASLCHEIKFVFEIKSKIYSFNLRLVLNHILNSEDVLSFRNLFFTLFVI
jgi:hypothetical protein